MNQQQDLAEVQCHACVKKDQFLQIYLNKLLIKLEQPE
jgi:hypothetical protein